VWLGKSLFAILRAMHCITNRSMYANKVDTAASLPSKKRWTVPWALICLHYVGCRPGAPKPEYAVNRCNAPAVRT
jgi:hypothetical protein